MAASCEPNEQGVQQIVSLLAEGQKPGVDQSQARSEGGRGGRAA